MFYSAKTKDSLLFRDIEMFFFYYGRFFMNDKFSLHSSTTATAAELETISCKHEEQRTLKFTFFSWVDV